MIDFTDLSRGSRSATRMGIGLLLAVVLVATLLYSLDESSKLVSATFFLLSVAFGWTFVLTGALHARLLVRVGALSVYIVNTGYLLDLSSGANTTRTDLPDLANELFFSGALLAAPILLFAFRRGTRSLPLLELRVTLVIVGVTYLLIWIRFLQVAHYEPIWASIERQVIWFDFLTIPLLCYIGRNVAETACYVPDWLADNARRWLHRRVLGGVLLLVLVVQMGSFTTFFIRGGLDDGARQGITFETFLGAFGVLVIVGSFWWLFARRHLDDLGGTSGVQHLLQKAARVAAPLIVVFCLYELFISISGPICWRVRVGLAGSA